MSNQYWLDLPDEVKEQIDEASNIVRPRLKKTIANLRNDPRPANAKPLRNMIDHYRIRIEEYRIYYWVEDEQVTIHLLRVGKKHGPEFYED